MNKINRNNPRFYRIHGDNIVECERTLNLIINSLGESNLKISGPSASIVTPRFTIEKMKEKLHFTFFPGFKRWQQDILEFIRILGGKLREAADAIITEVRDDIEIPLLAIEYCGALPAGNQAWQRSGRAYSFAKANIPYLYIAEIGGFELDSKRRRKSTRLPNPAVPFSYLSYSIFENAPISAVYIRNPGSDESVDGDFYSDSDLLRFIRAIINRYDTHKIKEALDKRALNLVCSLSERRKIRDSLLPVQWIELYEVLKNGDLLTKYLIDNVRQPWQKTAYISSLTSTASSLMNLTSRFAIGLTGIRLPMCIISANKRIDYSKELQNLYENLSVDFMKWLEKDSDLAICWVMGFKPRGDDARPDRGLVPMTRMLVCDDVDLLTIVYGPAIPSMWYLLDKDPNLLMEKNGLWEAILSVSDAILIDSATDNKITKKGYVKSHWTKGKITYTEKKFFVPEIPQSLGEQDIDTVLHNIFKHFLSHQVFEGMCNPPGGDWSGVSILNSSRSKEYRWLSLPRVSGKGTKRPDHIFQLFNMTPHPIILAIESKEHAHAIEKNIGPRLIGYVEKLFSTKANIEKKLPDSDWKNSDAINIHQRMTLASASAYLETTPIEMDIIKERVKCDLIFGISFREGGKICYLRILTSSHLGEVIKSSISSALKFQKQDLCFIINN